MKKIILILLLLISFVQSENNITLEEVLLLKTEQNLSLDEVKQKDNSFKKIIKNEKIDNIHQHYWIRVKLNKEMQTGMYLVRHGMIKFDISSFRKEQSIYKLEELGVNKFSFYYNKKQDEQYYYFHVDASALGFYFENEIKITTMENFMIETAEYFAYLVFCGLVLGIILMAGLYNLFIYYYNREKSFLYYALMQFFMVSILLFLTGLIENTQANFQLYNFLSLLTALFATLFTREFFNTSIHLPKLDNFLRFYMWFIIMDLAFNSIMANSIIEEFSLYSIFGFAYLIVAYLRLKQGFAPAKFFLIGWGALIVSLFFLEYFEEFLVINLLLIGSPIEAILLAIALAYKIKLIQNEKEQQKELMIHQSKLASMGEMIGNIAHQWRQPLTHLSYTVMNIQDAYQHKSLDEKYLNKKVNEATTQIEFMSQTIDDFKDFYAVKKERELFSLAHETEQVLEIMKHALKEQDIEVELILKEDVELLNYKNEYKQVLLNLLSNAKDVLIERVVLSPKITIVIDKNLVAVEDNGGGVELKIIHKIFEPYFTTKEKNSGIGLYMSKMIVEKNMGGRLRVKNSESGSIFKINF